MLTFHVHKESRAIVKLNWWLSFTQNCIAYITSALSVHLSNLCYFIIVHTQNSSAPNQLSFLDIAVHHTSESKSYTFVHIVWNNSTNLSYYHLEVVCTLTIFKICTALALIFSICREFWAIPVVGKAEYVRHGIFRWRTFEISFLWSFMLLILVYSMSIYPTYFTNNYRTWKQLLLFIGI